jgi:hypothetical protein
VKKLDYHQWEELKVQLLRAYSDAGKEVRPVESLRLIHLLNQLGYHPGSHQDAPILAEELLEIGWE